MLHQRGEDQLNFDRDVCYKGMLFSALFRKNIGSLDDSQVIALVRKNNREAAGEIYRRYATLVMGICLKYMKNEMVAEDMVMDIFEQLPEKIKKNDIQNFKSWLHSVTRNSCLMDLRKKKKDTGDIDTALLYAEDESTKSIQEVFAKEEQLTVLEAVLNTLKEDQKKALVYFYLENKSYDQVAQLMLIPLKKVKSLIQNGKRNLKLKLEESNAF